MQDTNDTCQYESTDADERYVAGTLSPTEADEFERHYFECDRCWARVQRGTEIKAALSDPPVLSIDSARTSNAGARTQGRSGVRWATPLAAAAVLLLGFGLWRNRSVADFTSVTAGTGGTSAVTRGSAKNIEVSSHRDGSMLIAAWPPAPSASSYRVRLLSPDGTLLYERETADTSVVLPEDSAGSPRSTAYWEIQALNELRNVIAVSALTSIASQGARR